MQNLFRLTLPKHVHFEVCYKTSPYSDKPTSTLCATIRVDTASGERWNISVGIVTGLHAGHQRTIGLTPGRSKIYISLPQNFQNDFAVHLGSYWLGTEESFPSGKRPGNEAHDFHLVPRLIMCGSVPPVAPCVLRVQVLLTVLVHNVIWCKYQCHILYYSNLCLINKSLQNNYQHDDTYGLSFISGVVVIHSTCFELSEAHHQVFIFHCTVSLWYSV